MKVALSLQVVLGTLVACGGVAPYAIADERLELGGISLGQSESAVVELLGKPLERYEEEGFLPVTLVYPDFEVSLDEDGVGGIRSTNKSLCTATRICPGMMYAQVIEVYGPSDLYHRDSRTFRDYGWNDGCWLRLEFAGQAVSTVEVLCSP